MADTTKLFGGQGFPNWLLVLVAAAWAYECVVTHIPQVLHGYRYDPYWIETNLQMRRVNPRWWLTIHSATACIVFFQWVVQMCQPLRKASPAFHRWNGRISIVAWLSLGITTPATAFNVTQPEQQSLFLTRLVISLLGVFTISWIGVGWVAVAKWQDIALHRQCMCRVFTATFSLVILARHVIALYHKVIMRSKDPYWFDVGVLGCAPFCFMLTEVMPYLMEKSFGTPWEYRVFGFYKLWEQSQFEVAVAEENQGREMNSSLKS